MAKQKQNPSDKGNIKKPRGGEERTSCRCQATVARKPQAGGHTHTHTKRSKTRHSIARRNSAEPPLQLQDKTRKTGAFPHTILQELENTRGSSGAHGGLPPICIASSRAVAAAAREGESGMPHAALRAVRGWWGGGRPCSASVGAMRAKEYEMEGGGRRGGEGQSE